ncbi:aldose epimerase [Paenibacillus thalictri]|uniref:Aldose epimerase n=1 Tax=Paenibacillus thalictri TaxID=2527873 RepID=A0A4Q9DE25_9BACL|nr:aldose epimerase [Paenibacillus thalictri]TBL68021.1 aldose epimerase [Paenibacillus thalictri]
MTNNYRFRTYEDRFQLYELSEASTRSSFTIAPQRGGIVISLVLHGKELLYLEQATLYDETANIRGGIPVLFPISGSLQQGEYDWEGRTYTMKNHGFARDLPWEVTAVNTNDSASITLRLSSNEETLASYPFNFELSFTYVLRQGTLSIFQEYRNLDGHSMPMYAGFHPYFRAESKHLVYDSDANTMFDMNDGTERPFDGTLDITDKKQAVQLLGASRNDIGFAAENGSPIRMSYGPEFRYTVVWSIPGQPFICVEPWMARPLEMNRKQDLTWVPPHSTLRTHLALKLE